MGYLGFYEVSNLGRVKSLKDNLGRDRELILKPQKRKDGYFVIGIKGSTKFLHRIIAEAFIPNPENKPQVNHKDSNRGNCQISNLEWVTASENILHGYKHGNIKPPRHRLGAQTGGGEFRQIYLDQRRNRWVASVEYLNEKGKKVGRKTFSIKKYGYEVAELLAANSVNELLDNINDLVRPRNIFDDRQKTLIAKAQQESK